MKLSVELFAEKPFILKEDSFIQMSLRLHGLIFPETEGKDEYHFSFLVLSGKSLAGVGREFTYELNLFPLGLGCIESRPGAFVELGEDKIDDLDVIIETNLTLDLGIFTDSFGLRLINEKGKTYDIPLSRPDIEIGWDSRGRFDVPITQFVNGTDS